MKRIEIVLALDTSRNMKKYDQPEIMTIWGSVIRREDILGMWTLASFQSNGKEVMKYKAHE